MTSSYYSFEVLSAIFSELLKGSDKREEGADSVCVLAEARVTLRSGDILSVRVPSKGE